MSVLATHLRPGPEHTFGKEPQESITLLRGIGVEGDIHSGKEDQHEYHRRIDTRNRGQIRDNLRQVHLIQSELYDGEDFHGLDGERVRPGQLGENITTVDIDLLALGKGAKLHFVDEGSGRRTASRKEHGWLKLAGRSNEVYISSIALALLILSTFCSGNVPLSLLVIILATIVALVRYILATRTTAAVVKLTGLRIPCNRIDVFRKGLKVKCQIPDDGNPPGMKGGVMGVVERGGVVRSGMKIVVEKAGVWEKLPTV